MCNMRTIGPAVSEKKIFEIVDDGRRTDDGRADGRTDAGSGELKIIMMGKDDRAKNIIAVTPKLMLKTSET